MDDANPTTSTPTPPPPTEPSWEQRRDRRDGGGRTVGVVGGLILLAIGLWFFAERTLDLDMPDIRWSQLWPLILIVIGLAILVGAMRRDRR